jgi:hypothetical protein
MAYTNLPPGQLLQTTQTFDTGDQKELLVRLYQAINNISMAVNSKESGQYYLTEILDSALYFNETSTNQDQLRPVYRKVINIGALGAGNTTIAHGLTIGATWSFTHIYGAASNATTGNYYPVPGETLFVKLNNTNVIISNGTGLTFTKCMVVLEYLKQ